MRRIFRIIIITTIIVLLLLFSIDKVGVEGISPLGCGMELGRTVCS